jgi:surfeit locus 1 family protein
MTVATVAFCALTVSLGLWQTRRAAEKDALQATLERRGREPARVLPARLIAADDYALRRVVARGEYADRFTILIDNRVHQGRVGFYVVSPLRIKGGDVHVLVNRGWVAAGRTRAELPRVATPAGEQTVEGSPSCRPSASTSSPPRPSKGRCGRTSVSTATASGRSSTSSRS